MLTTEQMQANFERALLHMGQFKTGDAPPQLAAKKIAKALEDLGIPYVVAGGLAVAANGLERTTEDVDLILTKAGLAKFKERWLGVGWVERFKGSKGLKDAEYALKVDILTPDEKPGDGKTCPFNFPDPSTVGKPFGGIWANMRMLDLRTLIELKCASWKTAKHRGRDMDDVIRLIKINSLGSDFGLQLQEFVRDQYAELWKLAQVKDPYDEP
ncbi:MAG: hypothetical protein IT462_03155 [Planctomycetes bacterium]|nr:hypothetical protein [Planctomycetota bacterium]